MRTRGNPIGIRATGQVAVDLSSQIGELHGKIVSADQQRASWISKQRILLEQRRGIRKSKNIPWKGCNNDSMPLIDGVLRRWKPNVVSLVMQANPVAHFYATKPDAVEGAKGAENFYHWKFHRIPGVLKTIMMLADMIGQYGYAWTRQGWKYQVERSCRVVSSKALFPNGIEQEVAAINQQLAQQAAEAAQTGAELPDPMTPEVLVTQRLKTEYDIDESDTDGDVPQLAQAVQGLINGAEFVKIYYEIVQEDRMDWRAISPLDVITQTRRADSVVEDFVVIAHRFTKDDVRNMVRNGTFKAEEAEEVVSKIEGARVGLSTQGDVGFDERTASQRHAISNALDAVEGVRRVGADEIARTIVWEIYSKLDVNADGLLEKVIVWYHPETKVVLSIIDYPFPFQEFPLSKFEFEVTSDRIYQSRGIAELLSTFQKQTNQLHNARLDAVHATREA